jgi:F-type H+-transporting ATPase subunit delta
MATLGKVANRYARALFASLKGAKEADAVLAELDTFGRTLASHKELALVIASPGFSEEQKTLITGDVASKMGLSPRASKILVGLSRMERWDYLGLILSKLRVLLLESEGVQPIHVQTSEVLAPEERKAVEAKFEKILGKKIEATYDTTKDLVGGLRVVAGGRTYDGTVLGWLETLKERLVEGEA